MKKSIYTFAFLLGFLSLSLNATAQKFGYVNSVKLLAELPEIKAADVQITTYQNQLISQGQQMVKTLEANYQKYMTEAESGTLSAIQQQQKEGALAAEQQEIQKFEYEVQNNIAQKREELYAPILEKVRNTISAMGEEEGYTMIFDASAGGLLSAGEGEDMTEKIKAKLGL